MNETGLGIYDCEIQYSEGFNDDNCRVTKWQLPPTVNLGDASLNEAAARVLYYSRQCGRWVGVSTYRLKIDVEIDKRLSVVHNRVRQANEIARMQYSDRVWLFWIFTVLTLGLYPIWVAKPVLALHSPPSEAPPLTVFADKGVVGLMPAINQLIDTGFLSFCEYQNPNGTCDQVVFPTSRLMRWMKPNFADHQKLREYWADEVGCSHYSHH